MNRFVPSLLLLCRPFFHPPPIHSPQRVRDGKEKRRRERENEREREREKTGKCPRQRARCARSRGQSPASASIHRVCGPGFVARKTSRPGRWSAGPAAIGSRHRAGAEERAEIRADQKKEHQKEEQHPGSATASQRRKSRRDGSAGQVRHAVRLGAHHRNGHAWSGPRRRDDHTPDTTLRTQCTQHTKELAAAPGLGEHNPRCQGRRLPARPPAAQLRRKSQQKHTLETSIRGTLHAQPGPRQPHPAHANNARATEQNPRARKPRALLLPRTPLETRWSPLLAPLSPSRLNVWESASRRPDFFMGRGWDLRSCG